MPQIKKKKRPLKELSQIGLHVISSVKQPPRYLFFYSSNPSPFWSNRACWQRWTLDLIIILTGILTNLRHDVTSDDFSSTYRSLLMSLSPSCALNSYVSKFPKKMFFFNISSIDLNQGLKSSHFVLVSESKILERSTFSLSHIGQYRFRGDIWNLHLGLPISSNDVAFDCYQLN